jgi:hypothetical protein
MSHLSDSVLELGWVVLASRLLVLAVVGNGAAVAAAERGGEIVGIAWTVDRGADGVDYIWRTGWCRLDLCRWVEIERSLVNLAHLKSCPSILDRAVSMAYRFRWVNF